ncbi:MAG: aldo/keto reductase [Mangrovibacterium sp.]|nr:aldo/keto reductase [Mangrovibacterium sp.]
MEKRTCKNSGMELSVLGTGCRAFGGGEYWGYQYQKDVNEVVRQRRTSHFNCTATKECRHGEEGAEDETNADLDAIRRVCGETGLSMAELSVKWILKNPAITCTLVGSRNGKELKANVTAVSNPLSKAVKEELDRVTLPVMEKLGNGNKKSGRGAEI